MKLIILSPILNKLVVFSSICSSSLSYDIIKFKLVLISSLHRRQLFCVNIFSCIALPYIKIQLLLFLNYLYNFRLLINLDLILLQIVNL